MTNPLKHCVTVIACLKILLTFFGCSSEPEIPSKIGIPVKKVHNENFSILILGDSLTEGYGVGTEQAFPHLLEKKLNTEFFFDNNCSYKVINAGISGSTTSGGVSRIEWLLKSKPNFLIIALGGNDGLRGVPIEETKRNLEKIILAAQVKNIPTILAGMKIPPNYGIEYTQKFADLYLTLSQTKNVPLIPFLLEGVGGEPSLNLPDRIHPNALGHQKISETVFNFLIKHLPRK